MNRFSRAVIGLCGALFGFGASKYFLSAGYAEKWVPKWDLTGTAKILFMVAVAGVFALIFLSVAWAIHRRSGKLTKDIEATLLKLPLSEMITSIIGMLLGLAIAFLISGIITSIELLKTAYIGTIISVLLYLFLGTLGINIGRAMGAEMVKFGSRFTLFSASKEKGKSSVASPKILDTSVIIDGRIADVLRTGFIEGKIVIPEFVLVELRHIADSSDSLKRNRGRRGLDVLDKIQAEHGIEIYNTDGEKVLQEIPEVDVKLLKLAQMIHGVVVTNDLNLNKVAKIKGVEVLNINDLTNALKPVILPGEEMNILVVKEGKEDNQGLAYLDDGTMVVVEDGKRHIGSTIAATVTSILQTSAGRMIFVKPD